METQTKKVDHCDRCGAELSDVWGDTGTLFREKLLCGKCLADLQSNRYGMSNKTKVKSDG